MGLWAERVGEWDMEGKGRKGDGRLLVPPDFERLALHPVLRLLRTSVIGSETDFCVAKAKWGGGQGRSGRKDAKRERIKQVSLYLSLKRA
jgi:hypothetical protein